MGRALSPVLLAFLVACSGCPGGGGTPKDATDADDDVADAGPDAPIDAFVRCPGQTFFTGDYVDWDSSESSFLGIFEAEVYDHAEPATVDLTAPNGRAELCVAATGERQISFVHDSYIPMVFTMDQEAAAAGPFSARGLTPTQAATLFAGLGATANADAALVVVEILHFPGGEPVIGASIALGNAHDGAYRKDVNGDWINDSTTTDGPEVMFLNVTGAAEVDGDGGTYGNTTLIVTPPLGTTCVAPATLALGKAQVASTTIACD
jgi:hypothetical protein